MAMDAGKDKKPYFHEYFQIFTFIIQEKEGYGKLFS